MSNCMRNRRSRVGRWLGNFPLGSLESRAAARAVLLELDFAAQQQHAALFGTLTPLEQAFIEPVDDPGVKAVMLKMVRHVIIPRHQLFGWPLPTPEELRHMRQVSEGVGKDRAGTGSIRGQ